MIINSDFKDYYDYLAHQYRDNKIVYDREEIIIVDREKYPELYDFSQKYTRESVVYEKRKIVYRDTTEILLIAGRVFAFRSYFDTNECAHIRDYKEPYKMWQNSFWQKSEKLVENGARLPKALELNQKYAPIIYLHPRMSSDCIGILNPCLKQFSPPISTWEIFQDVMSVLGSVEPKIPEMDDKTKLDSHGFDHHSFRPTSRK